MSDSSYSFGGKVALTNYPYAKLQRELSDAGSFMPTARVCCWRRNIWNEKEVLNAVQSSSIVRAFN
jgi:hypothetical protein